MLSYRDFFEQLLLIQGKGVTWSILVEFSYYFILPVLALTYSLVLKNKLLPSIVLTIILIIIAQLVWPQSESITNDPRLGPYLPVFLMGSILALIFHKWQVYNFAENKKLTLLLDVLGILAALILIFMIPSVSSCILVKEIAPDYYHRQFMVYGLLWSIVVFLCVAGIGVIRKFFEISFLRYLGFISFSVYLLHPVVLELFKMIGIDIPMQGWIELFLTILISHISWVLIEVPASKIRLTRPV